MPKTIKELETLIFIELGNDKGLIKHNKEQALAQLEKTNEEIGQLRTAIGEYEEAKHDIANGESKYTDHDLPHLLQAIKIEAGDVLVTLAIQCAIQPDVADLSLAIPRERNFTLWTDAGNQSLIQMYICSFLDSEVMEVAIAQLALWVEGEVEVYGLGLDECLEAAVKQFTSISDANLLRATTVRDQ
ncbi:hypothetical protein [cf. Phormidesmis sp. LEGE 11477]|uniref:hypothetical protein n=1 Tax=cf. Phormidesmis sp. LEGE 11477 TaxID=1828680 RepID=UPI001882B8CB|nr:hypothetical protein [cf. Phormidesmis sp. LEGE 11477]MBE9064112.1 hypothetical protein [cf. Phormidesmis sp. LEGE 11477]